MKKILFLISFAILIFFFALNTYAQELHQDFQGTFKAEITNILGEESREIWNNTSVIYKQLEIKFLNGPQKGEKVIIESDFPEIKKGLKVYINHIILINGDEIFSIINIDRKNQIYFFIGLFILAIILLGGKQGIRSLLSLLLSFLTIFYVLLPGLLNGWNPLLASFLVSSIILFFAIFFTHGWNKESAVAFGGTMLSISLTSFLAIWAVKSTYLSGFSAEETTSLYFNTGGSLDFSGLLLGAIIIGVLGVLDDIAVTQAAIVTELYNSNNKIKPIEVYKRAMRIGKEHVGALVNTLVFAYTGTALPLLLLFKTREYDFETAINLEIFATEIIRTVVGSIGLIMTVPIVTLLAVYFLRNYKPKHKHSHVHHH
jgi:uncharacterized membrane protein